MTFRDTLGLALRNLGQAKLRTSLTTLGVSIGIASLAGMVSLGVGLQEQLVGPLLKSGMFDRITVEPGRRQAGPSVSVGRGAAGRPLPPILDDDVLKRIAALAHVKDVYFLYSSKNVVSTTSSGLFARLRRERPGGGARRLFDGTSTMTS